jgi:hypothetical protein
MTSTTKKLKVKMEKEEEEDWEDAHELKSRGYSRTLLHGYIPQSPNPSSHFPYV